MTSYADLLKNTQARVKEQTPQELGLPQPPLELPVPPDATLIRLPGPGELTIPEIGLRAAIEQRRSVRQYSQAALSQAELSYLLWLSQGVKEITARPATRRTVPSAGSRHAFETYLLVNRVEGLEPGLYRFAASQHAIYNVHASPVIHQEIIHACWDQRQVGQSALTFIWVAVSERMIWRYTDRGFRYLFLDAGHVCQNLCLAAQAIGCGACPIGGFRDDLLNAALKLDGEALFAIYLASVGKLPA